LRGIRYWHVFEIHPKLELQFVHKSHCRLALNDRSPWPRCEPAIV
jgi:hypothetical protein